MKPIPKDTIAVVCSRYNRNTDWTEKLNTVTPVTILVYDKCNPENPYNIPVNKGNEASVYLKYIIDHYHDLPEYTYFVHDEEFAWHHTGSVIDKLKEALDSGKKYYNINDKCHLDNIDPKLKMMVLEWYRIHVEKYLPITKLPQPIWGETHRGSAQFLVHSSRIQLMPLRFYQDLYDWILRTDLPNYYNGRMLEWTWHIYWDLASKI